MSVSIVLDGHKLLNPVDQPVNAAHGILFFAKLFIFITSPTDHVYSSDVYKE